MSVGTEGGHGHLVVIDDSPESRLALRYAARITARSGGRLALLHVLPKPEFMQWGGVQEAMAAEAQERAEQLLADAAQEVARIGAEPPALSVRQGRAIDEVLAHLRENSHIHVLVLGAAQKGAPGPLVSFFSGEAAGQLPCLVVIVPGGLDETAVDRLT